MKRRVRISLWHASLDKLTILKLLRVDLRKVLTFVTYLQEKEIEYGVGAQFFLQRFGIELTVEVGE